MEILELDLEDLDKYDLFNPSEAEKIELAAKTKLYEDIPKTFITYQFENKQETTEKTPRLGIKELAKIVEQPKVKKTRDRKTAIDKLILDSINELYIMTRFKYVKQYKEKSGESKYTHMPYTLSDNQVLKHIRQQETLAIFAGRDLTKFICFDVDSRKDLNYSKQLAKEVIEVLINTFNIDKQYINVSFSGSKGYHVEIFFAEAIDNLKAKLLYTAIMMFINPLNDAEVEFRPTFTQAVKVPLSINHKTGMTCCFVNTDTLEPILDQLHITTIKQMPISNLKELLKDTHLFTIENKKASEIEDVNKKINDLKFTAEDNEKQVVEFLTKGYLQREGTRNNMTLKAARLLNQQGQSEVDTLATLNEIMHNTWVNHRHMFEAERTLKKINEETERIVKTVFKKNYGLVTKTKEIKIYKSEMEAVITVKKGHLRNLFYSFILHSKKYAKKDGSFFFSYSTMSKMGNAQNRGSLLTYVSLLEEAGYIEIVNRGSLNKALTKEYGRVMFDTNTYRVTINKPEGLDPFIIYKSDKKEADLYKTAKKLVDAKTIKDNTSRDDWNNHFKKLYKK